MINLSLKRVFLATLLFWCPNHQLPQSLQPNPPHPPLSRLAYFQPRWGVMSILTLFAILCFPSVTNVFFLMIPPPWNMQFIVWLFAFIGFSQMFSFSRLFEVPDTTPWRRTHLIIRLLYAGVGGIVGTLANLGFSIGYIIPANPLTIPIWIDYFFTFFLFIALEIYPVTGGYIIGEHMLQTRQQYHQAPQPVNLTRLYPLLSPPLVFIMIILYNGIGFSYAVYGIVAVQYIILILILTVYFGETQPRRKTPP